MLRNCPVCGRLLTSPPGSPCSHCVAEEDEAVAAIAAYLSAGGMASLAAVVAGTGVPAKLIRRLVENGRIALAGDVQQATCLLCGAKLSGGPGKVCASCATKVRGGRRAVSPSAPAPAPASAPAAPRAASGPRGVGYHSRPVEADD